MKYFCKTCGHTEEVTTRLPKCPCGGLWSLDFSPPAFDLSQVDRDVWGLFRYRAFLPLLDESWKTISMGEGLTPVIPLEDGLLLKMDYFMPTLSFKDRGAAVLVSHMAAIGVDSVVQDSSGNAGNSVAAYCARAGIDCSIFVPEGTSPGKIGMIASHGAKVNVVPGSRDHCADVCRGEVDREGKYYANHVYNPFFYEGTKTYIYEVYEQLGRIPETIFVPLGNGTLFLGVLKGLSELLASRIISKMPKVVAVQSENCAPFAQTVAEGKKTLVRVTPTPTLAEGIAIGSPMRGQEILDLIYRFDIPVVIAPEDKILDARASLASRGIFCEHTTAANYAAYLAYSETHGKPGDCLLPMTGAGLKSEH